MRRALALVLGLAVAGALAPAAAIARASGPALTSDPAALDHATTCPDGRSHPGKPIVLLVHGTAVTADESWPWALGASLTATGWDWCQVELPDRALGDIQTASEYVVAAVRKLHRETGGKVDIVGHSQGALEPRWAVRWWPDVRADVDDLVTLAGANQGTLVTDVACIASSCAPAVWQMVRASNFLKALNKVPTPAGPSYTSIYSWTDDLVEPGVVDPVAAIPGGTNIAIQDVCPGRPVHHGSILFDAASVALVLDALSHPGPASPARFDSATCTQTVGPGVDAPTAMQKDFDLYFNGATALARHPTVSSEPPLRSYAK
jgi:triacylglycerol lipase